MQEFVGFVDRVLGLGLESRDIGLLQMCLRAIIVYVVTVAIVRLGKKRFMGRTTAFDVILGIMLGSIVSRAITGNAPFVPALAASAVLMAMHWLFSGIALHWHGFGHAIKGSPELLVRNGKVDEQMMRRVHMTEHDLWEDLRGKSVWDLKQVSEARLERSGQLSVIKAKPEPKVLEVRVAEGVQTLRIEITG
jgi:uncharacterized membrane protein YcaP (DUF421 family)